MTDRNALAKALRDEADRIRHHTEARMEKLYAAADALEEDDDPATESGAADTEAATETSVIDIVREAALSFGAAVLLDLKLLRERAIEKHPGDVERIKGNVYNAIFRLKARKELVIVPGGMNRTEKMQTPTIPAADSGNGHHA